jgi:YHS domain-containing protein
LATPRRTTGWLNPSTGEDIMRMLIVALALSLASFAAVAAENQFGATCAYGLSEYGVEVKTDCKINWQDPASGKTFCFSKEEARQEFLKNPEANIKKAEATYAKLHKN